MVTETADGIVAFASAGVYRPRECYDGIAEFSASMSRAPSEVAAMVGRRSTACATPRPRPDSGNWCPRVFVENTASRELLKQTGFREVGVYERHGKLDDRWRDVVIVEKLL